MEEVDLSDRGPSRSASVASEADESPDPRIQVELEQLNVATDTINKLEVDLDDGRMKFRQLLADSTHRIDLLAKRLGKCVEQSRPYYEARIHAKQALQETQTAAVRYERAMSQHAAAREMVFLAEEGFMEQGCKFDHTWQEMLNHATSKVNDAEREKMESAAEHRRTSALYHEAETRVKALQKDLKRAIAKSSLNARRSLLQMNNLVRMHQLQLLPYFELKAAVNQQLESQKQQVRQLEDSVARAKLTYSQALSNLETISDEIHRNRQSRLDLGVRGIGVGAESPLPPLQSVDGGLPLSSHPHHYTESSLTTSTHQEFKSLPGKLGPAAAPIMVTQQQARGATDSPTTTASCEPAVATTIAPATTTISACAPPPPPPSTQLPTATPGSEVEEARGQVEAGDIVVEEVDGGATSNDLTGWQVIGLGGAALSPATQYLTVEDRDSIVSDTESLASIEMLSDEAIAGLMLDEELAEASNSICTPLTTPVAEQGQPSTSLQQLPAFFHGYSSECKATADTTELLSPKSDPGASESDTTHLTHSLTEVRLDSQCYGSRQCQPPLTLDLYQDSSSEHSSPEDLTPGYAPLRDTPYSPEDFVPSSQDVSGPVSQACDGAAAGSGNPTHPPHTSWSTRTVPSSDK